MNKFDREIAAKVAERDTADSEDMVPAFITNEIVQAHKSGLAPQNEHTDFWNHYTYKAVRKDVGSYIAKVYGNSNDDEQIAPRLPGFDHVQRYYVIDRGADKDVAVRVELMTDDELEARVKYLRRRGRACLAHADELERFKNIRAQIAA